MVNHHFNPLRSLQVEQIQQS